MSEFSQTIDLTKVGSDHIEERILAICDTLGLQIENIAAGHVNATTPRKFASPPRDITILIEENSLTVKSKIAGSSAFDVARRTQRDVNEFLRILEDAEKAHTQELLDSLRERWRVLEAQTMEKREKERLEEAVWNNLLARPDSSLLVTYALLTLNILVFIFLSTQGAGILLPNAIVSIDWGSNYRPLTLSGDWWRIGTCIFLHFGIIHLAMNMYALHEIGAYLEPLLGRTKFLAAYMSTGILASLVSLRWYQEPVNSAGASGAIFGMYGVFLMLLCTEIVPQARRKHLLPSIGAFVFYNLAHGTSSGVDNAAHIGGLFSGLFFGYFFYYSLALRQRGAEARWVTPSIILTALAFSGLYLSSHHVSADVRRKTFLELKDYRFADADTYLTLYNQFVDIQDEAIKGLKATLKNPRRQTDLKAKWEAAAKLLDKMEGLSVSENKKRKTALLKNYTALRIEEVSLWANIREHGTDDLASKKIDSLYERINKLSEEITALN